MAAAKRELFKSPDVCEMAQLQPYVLRSWEAEFPGLGQPTTAGGGRIYRRVDVELVLRIKQLVFVEGLTLAGARRRLDEERQADGPVEPSVAALGIDDALGEMARTRLRKVRTGLEAIMRLLDRDGNRPHALELQLVPPPASGHTSRSRTPSKRSLATARGPAKGVAKRAAGKRRAS
jgi:DNA-binding transcriptional MerR regulator